MNRIAEYAYVESAKETHRIRQREMVYDATGLLWQILERNPALESISYEDASRFRDLISKFRSTLSDNPQPQVIIVLYALIAYTLLLNLQRTLEKAI